MFIDFEDYDVSARGHLDDRQRDMFSC
jgi:hypothetical protein